MWQLLILNIFLIIFELLCFSINHLCSNVNWSVFGTIDWYLQEQCLSQHVSQVLRGSVLFSVLSVAKLIFCSLIIFWAAHIPTFANLPASSFWGILQCAGECVTLKEKTFQWIADIYYFFYFDLMCFLWGKRCGINSSNTIPKYLNCVCTNFGLSWEYMLEY